MTVAELEQRLQDLEAEVRELKARAPRPDKADPAWVLAHAGRFASDPTFPDAVKFGRAYRDKVNRDSLKAPDRGKVGPKR